MSPEATFLFLSIALVCFIVSAVLYWPRDRAAIFLCAGLAAWVCVAWWAALKAL